MLSGPDGRILLLLVPAEEPGETEKKRVLSCVVKETTFDIFMEQCEKDLVTYPRARHSAEASWQIGQLSLCIKTCATTTDSVVVMDYAENYRVAYQNEVQSAYFDPVQITIHPMMIIYRSGELLVKHSIIGISDDHKHDASGVKEFQKAALLKLAEQGITITSVHEWTDGSAAQYKGKNAFADITEKMIPTIRNYFVTSHGKNVCDGLGAVVKNMALRHIIGGNVIADAEGMMKFCQSKVAHDPRHQQEW